MDQNTNNWRSTVLLSSAIVLALCIATPSLAGNTFIYKDRKGRTHITNVKGDAPAGYKLFRSIETPTYKRIPAQPKATLAVDVASAVQAGALRSGSAGWQLITPNKNNKHNQAAIMAGIGAPKGKQPYRISSKKRQTYAGIVAKAASKHNLDPHLVHAVISAESAYNPKAKSHAGAMGMMQLMPATAARFGVKNAYDPVANINAGTRYLRWLLNYFDGNVKLALAGYNAGEGAVLKYNRQIPPYKETQNYVKKVLQYYHRYRNQG